MLHDAHEYAAPPSSTTGDLIHLWPRNRNVDSRVYDLARTLNDGYVDPTVRRAGFTTGIYGILNGPDGEPVAQVAGDEDEADPAQHGGLPTSTGCSSRPGFDDGLENDQAGNNRRVDSHEAAIAGTFPVHAGKG